jgi:hypothetical protein
MLKPEEHEKQISEIIGLLNVEGIDQGKVSTIVQALRDNYAEVTTSIDSDIKKISEINALNEGLKNANSMLLVKLATQDANFNKPNKEEPKPPDKNVKSLEEISKEFLK